MTDTWAVELNVLLKATADGGRRSAAEMEPGLRLGYRPNWGLPSMKPPEQTGAPVFAFGRSRVEPGSDAVRAVIVVPYPQMVGRWRDEVRPGTDLPMYEGPRVVGKGTVLWRRSAHYPPTESDASLFEAWLAGGQMVDSDG